MARALSLALVLLAATAQAAPKIDLSAFFPPGGTPGDYKEWRSDTGGTRLVELLDVTFGRAGIGYLTRVTEDGEVVLRWGGLTPGKWIVDGGASNGEVDILFSKPVRRLPLQIVTGKPTRYRGSGRVYYFGELIGKAKLSGTVTFVGFGPVTTPYWSVSNAANFVETSVLTISIRGAGEVRTEAVSTWSTDVDLGGIQSFDHSRTFENGVLVDESGPATWWFERGVLGGLPVPP